MDYPTCPDCQRYKEAAFLDAIEFSKFRTMLQIADDQLTTLRAENERLTELTRLNKMAIEDLQRDNERLARVYGGEQAQQLRAALRSKGE